MTPTQRAAMEQAIAALEGIQRYGLDTLSGRTDGPDDREWQRAGVNEMTKRARLGIAPLRAALAEPAPDQKTIGWIDDDARLGWAMWRIKDLEQQLGSRPAPQAQQPAPVQKSECGRYTWVPVKPSTAMLIAGSHCQPGDYSASLVWEEMIACADRTDYLRPIDPPNTQQKSPPADVPLLTPKEIEGAWIKELGATFGYGPFARAIEQAVRQKAGLK